MWLAMNRFGWAVKPSFREHCAAWAFVVQHVKPEEILDRTLILTAMKSLGGLLVWLHSAKCWGQLA